MKKFYILLVFISAQISFAQTVIYSENMGTPSGETAISAHTFENGSPISYSGNATVRTTSPSTVYEGASGDGSIFFASVLTTQSLTIAGINTVNFDNISLSFGHYKSTNAGSNELTVEVSPDGTNWSPLTYSRSTGNGTSSWILITPSGAIPSTANLRIRFANPTNSTTALSVGFRVDDIKITGNALNVSKNEIAGFNMYPNPATSNTLYIDTQNNAEKTIVIFDVLGKMIINTKTASNNINISALRSGVYIIKVSENGKNLTRKLVVR